MVFLEGICNATVNLLMSKLSNSYGLKVGLDWELPNIYNTETYRKTTQKS